MKKFLFAVVAVILLEVAGTWAYDTYGPQQNPDSNHTHADFAVWVNGKQLDFSADTFMSGLSTDAGTHPTEGPRKYLHLHDGNGHVIHRHKPGMTLQQFFVSLDYHFHRDPHCMAVGLILEQSGKGKADPSICDTTEKKWRFFLNGTEKPYDSGLDYVFEDGDRLLFTYGADDREVQRELRQLTDDACKYSKTCPWKGPAPTENCIADPEVPCTL